MERTPRPPGPSRPLSALRRIDAICDRFEAALREPVPPRIEDYLDAADDQDRPVLLRELMAIEDDWRRGCVEATDAKEARREEGGTRALDWLGREDGPGDSEAMVAALRAWVADDRTSLEQLIETFGPLDGAILGELARSLGRFLEQSEARGARPDREEPDGAPDPGPETDPDPSDIGRARTGAASRFVILEPYREGSLGEIFVAYDTELKRKVALKRIKESSTRSEERRLRFLMEAVITGQLEHPAIVPVYGLGFDGRGRPYYAMKLIRGQTLHEAIARLHEGPKASSFRGRSDAFRRLLRHFLDLCDAVAYANERGVLHRDLKPANVILGAFGETVILDWGVAKLIENPPGAGSKGGDAVDRVVGIGPEGASQTQDGWALGTPAFMSPEQAAGQVDRLGPACDVYGLGATLYAILTGRPPVEGSETLDVLRRVREGKYPAPREVNPFLPRSLEAICRKAMARRPEDRYPGAPGLRNDLERWLAGEPVSAWTEPTTARLWRWIGRHPTATSLVGVGAVAMVIVAAVASDAMHRASVVEILRRGEALRHAEQINDVTYTNAEKSAREHVYRRQPGWTAGALDEIRRGAGIPTPIRSAATLRGLAAAAHAGFDLRERLEVTTINSACLAFSPDGRRLAVGEHHQEASTSCRVQVFDVASAEKVSEYPILDQQVDTKRTGASALAFSRDGRWLAAGLRSGAIRVWDTRLADPQPADLHGHEEQVRGLAFTPDGTTLISGAREGSVVLWDVGSGWEERLRFDVDDVIGLLDLNPDGNLLALASNGMCTVMDLSSLMASPSSPRRTLRVGEYFERVAFSPDGRTVAATDFDRNLRVGLGRGETGRILLDRDLGVTHLDGVTGLEFHPKDSLLVTGSADNTLKVWDLAADQLLFRMPVLTESAVVPAFRPPDGQLLAVATSEGTTLFDVRGLDVLTTGALQDDPVRQFTFVEGPPRERSRLATMSVERDAGTSDRHGLISFWDLGAAVPRSRLTFRRGTRDYPSLPAIDAQPAHPMIAHNAEHRLRLRDVARGSLVTESPEEKASALRFSRDGQRLWGLVDEERVVSWSVPGLEPRTTWDLDRTIGLRGRIGLTCLAAGEQWVVAGSRGGLAYLLRASDGKKVRHLGTGAAIQSIAMTADESLVACGLIDGRLRLFRVPTGEPVAEISAHPDTVNAVAFSPDDTLLVSASRDRTAGLWRVEASSLTELFRLPSPSGHPILSVRFNADGTLLGMLVQNERAVRLWDLRELRGRLKDIGLDWD